MMKCPVVDHLNDLAGPKKKPRCPEPLAIDDLTETEIAVSDNTERARLYIGTESMVVNLLDEDVAEIMKWCGEYLMWRKSK